MSGPTEEEEVVVSLRLQPVVARPQGWRGRSSSFVAVGLVAFIVAGIALGAAFDGGVPASSAAAVDPLASSVAGSGTTARPNPTLRPRLPPLPALQVIGGTIPTERRLVVANGLQVLDLGTGRLTSPPRPYEDILLPRGDELVCACMVRRSSGGDATTSSVILRFERLDTNGALLAEREVITYDGVVEVPEMSPGFSLAAAVSRDERFLFVLTAVRRPPVWTVELHQLGAESGELVGTTVLDEFPVDLDRAPEATESGSPSASPSGEPYGAPPDGIYIWANWMAKSPDGGVVAAMVSYSEVEGDTWTSGFREWIVPVADARPGEAIAVSTGAHVDPNGWCAGLPEFVDNELLVQVCTSSEGPQPEFHVRRVTTAGETLSPLVLPIDLSEDWYAPTTALDRMRRAILTWDPVRHSLARVALDDGTSMVREVARSMLPDSKASSRRGYFGANPGLVLSPDGQRIYALGFGLGSGDNGAPTGVWVFDAETLNLVDRWLPRAMFTSLGVSADGQFVYAAGANGFDVLGNQNPWPSSVTVYDAATGEVQVIYGEVTDDAWLSFHQVP
jgi:hypothetical protein